MSWCICATDSDLAAAIVRLRTGIVFLLYGHRYVRFRQHAIGTPDDLVVYSTAAPLFHEPWNQVRLTPDIVISRNDDAGLPA